MNMITKQIKLLIFDMDGLLVDTERVYKAGWEYGLHKENLYVPVEILNSWTGKSMHDTTAYIMNLCLDEVICDRVKKYREDYIYACLSDGSLSAKPYAQEALQSAYKQGYIIALATSTNKKRAIDILTRLNLFQYIHFPVFADDVKLLKPFPDVYLEVLHRANMKAEHAMAFEDSLTGYNAAQAAQITTVLIPDQSFEMSEDFMKKVVLQEKDLSVIMKWIDQIDDMR